MLASLKRVNTDTSYIKIIIIESIPYSLHECKNMSLFRARCLRWQVTNQNTHGQVLLASIYGFFCEKVHCNIATTYCHLSMYLCFFLRDQSRISILLLDFWYVGQHWLWVLWSLSLQLVTTMVSYELGKPWLLVGHECLLEYSLSCKVVSTTFIYDQWLTKV